MKAPAADRLFRALSEGTRLRILHILRDGELCVGDLMEILRIPQARTSRHLRYLWRAGLVRAREEGLWSFYSLAPAGNRFRRKLLECVAACPESAADRRRAARLRKGGGCCPK